MTWCLPQDGHGERIIISNSHVKTKAAIPNRISSTPSMTITKDCAGETTDTDIAGTGIRRSRGWFAETAPLAIRSHRTAVQWTRGHCGLRCDGPRADARADQESPDGLASAGSSRHLHRRDRTCRQS
jgi:hypothetical protein